MLSPLTANHRIAYIRCLSLNRTRNFASASNGLPPKFARAMSELAPEPDETLEGGHSLATSLNHYFSLPPLPPTEDWVNRIPWGVPRVRGRVSISAPAAAVRVAQSFVNSKKTITGNPKVIIEAFPGPGALSRALLTLPPSQLKRLIILEDYEPYLEHLRPLAQADPRVRVVSQSGFAWETYSHLIESGDLDVDIAPWENLHPELHFVTHIPHTIPGEQFVAQLFRAIPAKSWLFKYGRMPMSFILPDGVWQRFSSPPESRRRCKLSLSPFPDHFHPTTNASRVPNSTARPEARRRGSPFLAVNIVPHDQQVIKKGEMDQWDYILRRLFVLKSTQLRRAMSSLAPGAEVLLDTLTDEKLPPEQRVDVRLPVKDLTVSDWTLIQRAFDAWPFAPDNLDIDSFSIDDRE
ncbi:S-adenosyl-L-methionine-dependent methyltransferase [Russula brevipes]|nr:S-adenosyl-L-methionine-dependent methyltransferase [Russula brevipes]